VLVKRGLKSKRGKVMIDYILNCIYSIIPHNIDMWFWYVGIWFIMACLVITILSFVKLIGFINKGD
jgi:predicted ferric reductase